MTDKQLLEMKQKRAALIKQSREAYETLMESKAAEDKNKYENIEADIAQLDEQIAEVEKHISREKELSERVTENPEPLKEDRKSQKITESEDYVKFFESYLRGGKVSGYNLPLSEAIVNGSYIVPQDYENKIKETKKDFSVMRRLADVISVSHDRNVPIEGTLGTSAWIDAEGAYPDNDLGFNTKLLKPYKVGRIIPVAEEILMDNEVNLERYIARKFGESNAKAEETAFFTGDGTGKPTGLVGSASVGKTAASNSALTYDELLDLFYALEDGYVMNGSWVMNRDTLKVVRQLKDGSGRYIFQPGIKVDQIEGKPVYTTYAMPTIASDTAVVAFGDFGYYQIVDRVGFMLQRLNETYAKNGQIGFKGFSRVDGQLLVPDAVKTLKMAV